MKKTAAVLFIGFVFIFGTIAGMRPAYGYDGKTEEGLLAGLNNAKNQEARSVALAQLTGYYLPLNRIDKAVDAYRRTINDANIGKKEKYAYYMTIGDIFINVKNYSSAIDFYLEAVNVMPKREEARLKLAGVYEQSDLNELAKLAYLDDLKVNKRSFDADFGLASLYMKLGLNTQAMEYFRRGLTIKTEPDIYRKTALCAETLGDVAIACAMLRRIPVEQMAYEDLLNLGRLYEENDRMKDAEETFSLAIKADTQNVNGYIYMALLYMDNNDLPPAEKLLQIAREKAPAEGSVHFFLGCIYSAQKRTGLASEEMRKAGSLAKTDILKIYSAKFQNFISK